MSYHNPGQISQHFNRSEFVCKCGCGGNTVDVELITVLEKLRYESGQKPIIVSSGYRCLSHNIAVGGSPKSQHLIGKAADINIKGLDPANVASLIELWFPNQYGMGLYNNWVHIDVRYNKVRWDSRTGGGS